MAAASTPLPALSDAEVQALGGAGFFVRERYLEPALALAARSEAEALRRAGRLSPAAIARERRVEASIRGDSKLWLTEEDEGRALTSVRAALLSLGMASSQAAYLGLSRHDVQLAYYEGGAAYARHRDAFRGAESRRLTVITYLNEGWQPAHGGALRLFPADGGESLELPPRLGTAVVFLSETVEHEVLASHAPRWALTAWFYAR